jgi:hypothetical protein
MVQFPLRDACACGHLAIVKCLWEVYKTVPGAYMYLLSGLKAACQWKKNAVVQWIVQLKLRKATVQCPGGPQKSNEEHVLWYRILDQIVEVDDTQMLAILLAPGSQFHNVYTVYTLLTSAEMHRSLQVMKYLYQTVAAEGDEFLKKNHILKCLLLAIERNDGAFACSIVQKHKDWCDFSEARIVPNYTALSACCNTTDGNFDVVRCLVEVAKVSVETRVGPCSRTALFFAVKLGHTHIVRYLLQHKALAKTVDSLGFSPLCYLLQGRVNVERAIRCPSEKVCDVARLLCEEGGAKVNIACCVSYGTAPLVAAVRWRSVPLLQYLLGKCVGLDDTSVRGHALYTRMICETMRFRLYAPDVLQYLLAISSVSTFEECTRVSSLRAPVRHTPLHIAIVRQPAIDKTAVAALLACTQMRRVASPIYLDEALYTALCQETPDGTYCAELLVACGASLEAYTWLSFTRLDLLQLDLGRRLRVKVTQHVAAVREAVVGSLVEKGVPYGVSDLVYRYCQPMDVHVAISMLKND